MNSLNIRGMRLSYHDQGSGTPVLLVHCSSSSHKQWRFLFPALEERYRIVAPDLLGYGASSAWPEDCDGPPASDLDALQSLMGTLDSPVHIVAHSYGAAVALEAARLDAENDGKTIASLCIIEPVAFHLLRSLPDQRDWNCISKIARKCIEGVKSGNRKKAANAYMGFWLGALNWRLAPARFRDEVLRTIHKVAWEFGTMFDAREMPADYAGIDCPVTLIAGGKSPGPALQVCRLLESVLPHVTFADIPAAGHMSPLTHPNDIRLIVERHLRQLVSRAMVA